MASPYAKWLGPLHGTSHKSTLEYPSERNYWANEMVLLIDKAIADLKQEIADLKQEIDTKAILGSITKWDLIAHGVGTDQGYVNCLFINFTVIVVFAPQHHTIRAHG